jgi:hypothetical protein
MIDTGPAREVLVRSVIGMRKEQAQLRRASWAFTTRRIPQGTACSMLPLLGAPQAGDLVLARVTALGQHADLQLVNGRHRHMFVGDEIVVAYGNRYASSQFEAVVPETLGPCHLVAGGGIAARARSWHERIARGPTHITPLGLLGDANGQRINLDGFGLPPLDISSDYQPATIAVVGTSMDSGKTQTAVYLVRGLVAAGLRVGYAKATGTGAGGDIYWLKDAGADPVLDFTDTGMATTYLASSDKIEQALVTLIAHIARKGVDAIVIEIADGVLQQETAALLRSAPFARVTGGIVLAARDSMGANAGVDWMANLSTPVLALSGVMTAAPLQCTEAAEATGLPIHDREALASPSVALELVGRAQHHLETLERRPNDAA